jgi:hypothetical protein
MRVERHANDDSPGRADQMMAANHEQVPGYWDRLRLKKYIRPIHTAEETFLGRVIEVDLIFASAFEWERCMERRQAGWDVTAMAGGMILAERSIG